MICKKCGKEIADHLNFCIYCGQKIEEVRETEIQQQEDKQSQEFPFDLDSHEDCAALQDEEILLSVREASTISSIRTKGIIKILICALAVCVLVTAIFLLVDRNKPVEEVGQGNYFAQAYDSTLPASQVKDKEIEEEIDIEEGKEVSEKEEAKDGKTVPKDEAESPKQPTETTSKEEVTYDSKIYGDVLKISTIRKPTEYEDCSIGKIYVKRVQDGVQFTVFYQIPEACIFEAQIGAYNIVLKTTLSAKKDIIQFVVPLSKQKETNFSIFRLYEMGHDASGADAILVVRNESDTLAQVKAYPEDSVNGQVLNLDAGKGEKALNRKEATAEDETQPAEDETQSSSNTAEKLSIKEFGTKFDGYQIKELYAQKDGENVLFTIYFDTASKGGIAIFSPPDGAIFKSMKKFKKTTKKVTIKLVAKDILSGEKLVIRLWSETDSGPSAGGDGYFAELTDYRILRKIAET